MRPLIIAGIGLATTACGFGSAPPAPDLPPWKLGRDASGAEVRVVARGASTYLYALDGRLVQLNLDSDRDGKPDVFAYYTDSKTPDRVEIDGNHDGRIDRWESYDREGALVRYSLSSDGRRRDRTFVLDPQTGRAHRIESDADGDGRPERVEIFDAGGLARAEIDSNADGKTDRVQEWKAGRLTREEIDRNGDGSPDIRLIHDGAGAISRVEVLGGRRP